MILMYEYRKTVFTVNGWKYFASRIDLLLCTFSSHLYNFVEKDLIADGCPTA